MNNAAAEVNGVMKVVLAKQAGTIFIFNIALYTDEHSGAANYSQRTQTKCHQMKH